MSTVGLSDALAEWMTSHGATGVYIELCDSADGWRWCAAIVHDDHQPARSVKVLATCDEGPTCWQPLYDLAAGCQPVQDLGDPVDWGRLKDGP